MKVTIDDVVKKSGLSYVTVSRVISNSPNVREVNRKKVMEAIEELGYIPSAAARTLATGKTYVIAMFISDLGDDFFDSIVKEVNEQLLSKGYLLTLTVCDGGSNSINTAFLSQNRVDGAILLVPNREKYFIDIFKSKKIPFVVIDNQTMNEDITSVLADNIAGGYMSTRHLIDLGHTDIGFIGASAGSLSTMERQLGANKALTEASLVSFAIENGEYDQPTGYQAVMKWNDSIGLPSAIFAFDDHIAVGAINAIKDLGLQVPNDISVCGYDDSLLSKHYFPRITSVRQPAGELAESAVDKLLALIDGQEVGSFAMRFTPKLMIKESTKIKD
ncbi:MAG: LacI family transcriptional regulator [Herbinix sp.]|jgi:DNA-binding LacI/PurR family transcriptional regulator|nr:LacI family transcriptional regulator [Herbinix sp.]